MSDKFKNVPVEKDTIIVSRTDIKLDSYDVLYELWYWKGIIANSIIFDDNDITDVDDDALKVLVKPYIREKPETEVIVKRTDSGYTFVNFNYLDTDKEYEYE